MSAAAIGALRRRLELLAPQRTGDEGGGASESWTVIAEVWAAVAAISGSETVDAERVTGQLSHRITLRYRGDIRPEMRLSDGTRLFEIRAVLDENNRRRRLTLLCEERDL